MKSYAKFLFHDLQRFEEGKGTVRRRIRGIKIFSSMDVVSPMDWRIIVNQPMENIFTIITEFLYDIFDCIPNDLIIVDYKDLFLGDGTLVQFEILL